MKFVSKDFWIQMLSYGLIVMGALDLVYLSPNQLMYDPNDGGRAIIYICMFQTSLLVLHLQIGHLGRKLFKPFSVNAFVVSIVVEFAFIGMTFVCPDCA